MTTALRLRAALRPIRSALLTACALFVGCGSPPTGDPRRTATEATYTVGGSVTGLEGTGLALVLNGQAPLGVTGPGAFRFAEPLPDRGAWSVGVSSHPHSPRQRCAVTPASGVVAGADVNGIRVHCTTERFPLGGTIAGLAGKGLVLSLNGGAQTVSPAALAKAFTFPAPLPDGAPFRVTVAAQPHAPAQTCQIGNGVGQIAEDMVVAVVCTTDAEPPPPEPPPHDFTKLTPACFTGGEFPQLDFGGPVTDWTWNDPHVIKRDAEDYVLYASATDFFTFPVRLYRLTSTDATTWTLNPNVTVEQGILADAEPGAWDAGGLETPAVVFFNGQYHLFYTAYRYPNDSTQHSILNYRIGHAVSADGITFARASTAPVVAPSSPDITAENAWRAYVVAEPGPVVFNGELYLYFTALGIDFDLGTSLQILGVIRTSDGVTWSEPEPALRPAQDLYPRGNDWIGYSTPNAIVLDDRMHLFFDVAHQPDGGDWKQLRLHHASSTDGVGGWVHDAEAIRAAGDFAWATEEIRAPHALLDGDLLRLYFAGHKLNADPFHFGIGMMTCDVGRD